MSGAKRRSFEAGHRPKFMVVVDGTPECGRAIHFAARRCARTGATLVMLGVASPPESFEWKGVEDAMQAEAEAEAEAMLGVAASGARDQAGIAPETVVKLGEKADAILNLIEEDQDISFLVLAAATGGQGPGPLVSAVASRAGASFPIPVVIVPGDLADDEIQALAG